jgi:hypothetical protein
MAKKIFSKNNDTEYNGFDNIDEFEDIKKQTEVEELKKSKKDEVTIMFKQNRSFELHVGRQMIKFSPRETKPVSRSVIEHKDFEVVKDYFLIKEN